jgi:hypothetical protein
MNNGNWKQENIYSQGANDEQMSPSYLVTPLLKYIPKNWKIWCPFDKEYSEFVKVFLKNGYKIIFSHIDYGQDFYNYEPQEKYDCIISNPPFTNKKKIFERTLNFNKPFLLLAPCTWFNDSALSKLFGDGNEMQVMFFDKRVKFRNNGVIQNKITFASCFIGKGILPRQIVFEKLNIKEK